MSSLVFSALSAMMKADGLVPPPSETAYRAALSWWDSLDRELRSVWHAFGMSHVREWWTRQRDWLAQLRIHNPAASTVLFVFEFKFASVISDIGNLHWAMQKSFGPLTGIRLVSPDDEYFENHATVIHNDDSPWRQKWMQRNMLKRQLEPRLRTVINQARSMTWTSFRLRVEGGWSPAKRESIGYVTDRRAADTLMRAATEPGMKLSRVEVDADTAEVFAWVSRLHEPEERFAAAAHRIRRRYDWSLQDVWRHIGGKKLLPKSELFEQQPEQLTLFERRCVMHFVDVPIGSRFVFRQADNRRTPLSGVWRKDSPQTALGVARMNDGQRLVPEPTAAVESYVMPIEHPLEVGDLLIVGDGWDSDTQRPKFRAARVISFYGPDRWPRIRFDDDQSEQTVSPLVAEAGRANWLDPVGRGIRGHLDESAVSLLEVASV